MARSSNAASGPKIMSTLSRSISSCAFVFVPAGLPPVSATSSSAGRPASLLPLCFRNTATPCSIWNPPWASGPVLTVSRPILTGRSSAIAGFGNLAANAAAAPPARIVRRRSFEVIGRSLCVSPAQLYPAAIGRPAKSRRPTSAVRLGRRDLSAEHREDQLPIPVGRALVVDIAVGQRVAVLGAGMDLVPVAHRAGCQQPGKLLDDVWSRIRIVLGEAAIQLAPKTSGEPMRRILAIRDQGRAVQAGSRSEE